MTSASIMQPYFVPYAGYFRLFARTELFVIYDDVQFPKGGWVHRNRLSDQQGKLAWLTLPLKRKPLGTRICDMEFDEDGGGIWSQRLSRFPLLAETGDSRVNKLLGDLGENPLEYILRWLEFICDELKLPFNTIKSSSLKLPNSLKGQDRVLAVLKETGATEYVNLSRGADLYDKSAFREAGINLKILTPHEGSYASMLQRLLVEPTTDLKDEIRRNLTTS